MDFSEKTAQDVWHYIYTHEKTEATTGYYTCVPQEEMTFVENLRRLAERPLDSFLHQKLLGGLGEMPQPKWLEFAQACLTHDFMSLPALSDKIIGVLATLLVECCALIDSCASCLARELPDLKKLVTSIDALSPLPILFQKWNRISDNRFYGQAIEGLWSVKPDWPEINTNFRGNESIITYMEMLENQKGLLQKVYNQFQKPQTLTEESSSREVACLAQERLERAGILAGPEMRHESSLSPIALLRQWRLSTEISHGRHKHQLSGIATAYGRGLSLAQTRASCLMEIVERSSAHASIRADGEITNLAHPLYLLKGTAKDLLEQGLQPFCPDTRCIPEWEEMTLHWIEGYSAKGEKIFVPAQAVFLFLNLDEAAIFDRIASTGLASGSDEAGARLAALTEVLERDANATTLYDHHGCFIPQSRDEKLQSLLDDYRAKRIFIYMQDISTESGFPVYRSIVRDAYGQPFFATGAGLDGKRAAISALTETPWPYSWSSPFPSSKISMPIPYNLPVRYLEDLPNFSLGNHKSNLALLENLLEAKGHQIAYVDITRKELGFPVIRAFISDMETSSDYDQFSPPGLRFMARYYRLRKERNFQ